MGESTAIAWTDHTFNPWWGCARVSPGCQHCYAEALAKRFGHDVWGQRSDRRFFGDAHWREPLKWDREAAEAGRPALVFCASMADVFEGRPDLVDERFRLWELIRSTPHLIWQLLTKRPENVIDMVPSSWLMSIDASTFERPHERVSGWPSNVWVGTTVEDQQRAEERIWPLLRVPAPVRFLSCEPLLGSVRLSRWLRCIPESCRRKVEWVIVGGESGRGHRPLDLSHALEVVDQCESAGVPVFFKQVGGQWSGQLGDQLDGRTIKQFPKEARRDDPPV